MKKNIFYIVLIVGLVIFYWWRYRVPPNIAFEHVQIQTSLGDSIALSHVIKGPSVVHFYASWCGPCMAELRQMAELIPSTELKKLNYVFVTDDAWEKIDLIKSKMPEQLSIYKVNSLKDIGIYTLPTTYFINSKGEIVKEQVNPCAWDDANFQKDIFLLTQ